MLSEKKFFLVQEVVVVVVVVVAVVGRGLVPPAPAPFPYGPVVYSITWPNLIVWLLLLCQKSSNMCNCLLSGLWRHKFWT